MTQRAIFRCINRTCRHTWAVDYPERSFDGAYFRRIQETNEARFPSGDSFPGCPKCSSKYPKWGLVKGKHSDQKCDARCTNAKGFDCQCSCAGANHGAAFVCEAA